MGVALPASMGIGKISELISEGAAKHTAASSAWLSGAQLRLIASGLTDARGKSARDQSPTVLGTIRAVGSEGLP